MRLCHLLPSRLAADASVSLCLVCLCASCCSLLSNGVAAAARPTPQGFPFPNPQVPLVFVHVDGLETSSARGSKMNEKVRLALTPELQ